MSTYSVTPNKQSNDLLKKASNDPFKQTEKVIELLLYTKANCF